ncbi:hypothetical protein BKA82DRAFT_4359364 [Pisolithus tinctorius]|nr:hypothetical protein BKA82DRAFT_4359364 [Pisolithus tinctorius]
MFSECEKEQREKARLRAARNRTNLSQRVKIPPTTQHDQRSWSVPGPRAQLVPTPFGTFGTPPLEKVRQLIADWQSEWGTESTWPKKFHDQLRHAQGRARLATDSFFSQCEAHVEEGRRLVWILRNIARKVSGVWGTGAADLYEQVFDLLTSLLTELRFFEVKLDDYAPISPLSRISDSSLLLLLSSPFVIQTTSIYSSPDI